MTTIDIPLDQGTITIISLIVTSILGFVAKKYQNSSVKAKEVIDVVSRKADLGALLIKKIKDANIDNQITPDEFTGIVNTAEQLISKED